MLSLKNIIIYILILLFSYLIVINLIDLIPSKIIENLTNDVPEIKNLQDQVTELHNSQTSLKRKYNNLIEAFNNNKDNTSDQLNDQATQKKVKNKNSLTSGINFLHENAQNAINN